jgi:hypothetical protein
MHANTRKNDGPSFVANESFVLNKMVRLSKKKNGVFNFIFFNLWQRLVTGFYFCFPL